MLRSGHVIALCVFALLTLGVVMISSAKMQVISSPRPEIPVLGAPAAVASVAVPTATPVTFRSIVGSKSAIHLVLALGALAFASLLPVRAFASRVRGDGTSTGGLRLLALGVISLIAVLAVVYIPGIADSKKGAARWIELPLPGLGGLSVQPSEIVKWAFVVLLAAYGVRRAAHMPKFFIGLVPALIALGAVVGFVTIEDLGTGALIGAASCVVLVAAGANFWHFGAFVPFAIAGLTAAIVTSDYRIARITAYVSPYADAENTGYHMIQSMAAVAGGEGFGRGLGHGQQKLGFLLEDDSDFVFGVICEELGIAGAGAVIGLYVLLLWTGVSIVRREQDPFLKLIGVGFMTTIGLQALINIAVVTGIGPTKGIALPLISSGGTGWLLTSFCMGLLIAIDRTQPQTQRESNALGAAGDGDLSESDAIGHSA